MMKRLWVLLLFALPALAQTNIPTWQYVTSAPTGTCVGYPPMQVTIPAYTFYACVIGSWAQVNGSGSGSGSVTSFVASSGSWPTWLTPSVANPTTTPTLSVASSVIPNSALANASITIGTTTLTLGGTVSSLAGLGSATAKCINGVCFSDLYAGSTLDVRVNAAMAAAIAQTSPSTAYKVSSINETGNQTIAAQINVGNSAGIDVAWELPCNAVWTETATDGSVGVNYYGGASIYDLCPSAGIANAMNIAVGPSSNVNYAFQTTTSSQPYLYLSGFTVKNTTGTNPTASGILLYLNGPFNDGSLISQLNTYDTADTYNVKVYNVSSGFMWQNSEFNAGNHGNGLFMFTDASGYVQSITFLNDTFVHPGTGNYAVYGLDTRSSPTNKISGGNFVGSYTETNPDGVTPSFNFSGWGMANILDFTEKCYSTSGNCTAPFAHVSNAYNTALMIGGGWCGRGQNDFTLPCTVVVNDYDSVPAGVVVSDANGHFGHYTPKSIQSVFGQLIAASITVNGTGPGGITPAAYSAAGTAIPACTGANVNTQSAVSDATTFTFGATYAGGGANSSPVVCHYNGTSYTWVIY